MSSTSSIPASGKITGVQVRIVAVVVLGAFLALLNQTVMSPALPIIMADFGIDASTAQWIMSIYPLVSGIMVPVSAYLIDKFSTRKLFFGALVAFAAGTLLCAVAPDFLWLIVGRVLQAAGSGVLMPLVAVVPMLVFPVEKRGTAMGMAGIVMSAGPAVGPVAGGAVIDAFGWRAMVGAIVPLSLIVLVMGVFMLKNVGELKNPKLDFASVALSTVAFGGLLYGFSIASSLGWTSPVVLGSVAAGVVCLVLFARRQGKLEQPLLDLGCLRTREFRVAAIIVTLINAACLVTNTLLPLLLQTALGASAFETGMAMLPAAAVGIIISPISGVVFDKFGPRVISVVGLALMTGALFALSLSSTATPILVVALFCMLQAAGQALANMPVNTWGVNALRNEMIAHGNAIANTGRQVAGGLCTALIVTVMTSVTAGGTAAGATLQAATATGAGVAYKVCAAIGLVSLVYCIVAVRPAKRKAASSPAVANSAAKGSSAASSAATSPSGSDGVASASALEHAASPADADTSSALGHAASPVGADTPSAPSPSVSATASASVKENR